MGQMGKKGEKEVKKKGEVVETYHHLIKTCWDIV
jgi:hypothetical protein